MPAVLSPASLERSDPRDAAVPLTDDNSILYAGGIRVVRAEHAASAPAFELHDSHGRVYTPEALRDRVVWLDLWADWCATCRAEFPSVQRLHERYDSAGLTILAVCRNSTREGFVSATYKDWISFRVVDASEDAAFPFPYAAFPTSVLLDRSGRVRAYWQGHRSLESVELVIRSLLAETLELPPERATASKAPAEQLRGSDTVVLARLELPRQELRPGSLLEGAIVLDLAPGWHLTAGVEEGSIPVSVATKGSEGLGGLDVLLPLPTQRTVGGTPREVYSGRVELPLWGLVRDDALGGGRQEVRVVATVQACDAQRCLVPSEIHLSGEVWVAGSPQ